MINIGAKHATDYVEEYMCEIVELYKYQYIGHITTLYNKIPSGIYSFWECKGI